jgi:hypothetical protein
MVGTTWPVIRGDAPKTIPFAIIHKNEALKLIKYGTTSAPNKPIP